MRAFDRIASSEQRYFRSTGTLLARYNVTDRVRNQSLPSPLSSTVRSL